MSTDSLPVYEPEELAIDPDRVAAEEVDAAAHAIVLAAGRSRRYGERNKLLEPIDGTPMVELVVGTAVDSLASGVTVVVGYEADRVRDALDDYDVDVRYNDEFEAGQSTSLSVGVEAAASRGADAIVVLLGDMPYVDRRSVNLVVAAQATGKWDAVAAACRGRRGNPVSFDSAYFDRLADVDGDVGGRQILLGSADAIAIETDDEGVLRDVDRPDDRSETEFERVDRPADRSEER